MKNWATQNPGNAEARIELARLYEEANDPDTAMKYLEDAVQKDANNPRAWLALAKLRQQSGDLQQALRNYQQSLAINPAQPMAAAEVAKLNHQISGNAQATSVPGQTQIAAPNYGGGFFEQVLTREPGPVTGTNGSHLQRCVHKTTANRVRNQRPDSRISTANLVSHNGKVAARVHPSAASRLEASDRRSMSANSLSDAALAYEASIKTSTVCQDPQSPQRSTTNTKS